jgi:hypothetical protein
LAVSRRFVARTEHALAELLGQDLFGLDLVALMVDGIRVAEHCCVVALGITIDGTKVPLGLVEGATENATVVGELLVGLREPVRVALVDGTTCDGTIEAVGSDYLELAEHDLGEARRRAAAVRARRFVGFAAVVAVTVPPEDPPGRR